jgi:arsenite/tail-anchored protein-transporting ATPase
MESIDEFLQNATRILFFTGKGGVGKTTLACATAAALAQKGKRVLLVSTDPASNLDEVLETKLSGTLTPISGMDHLYALNIDPEAAAAAYRERVVGPYRGVLPAAAIVRMEEQLSGACTVEIAAFDEFTKLLGDPQFTSGFDHLVFDTAPTGHTLRLLKLPASWTGFIASNTTGTSCLGPLAGLQAQKDQYEASLLALSDAHATTLVLVSRPEPSALKEAERTRMELTELGVNNHFLFLNGIFEAQDSTDPVAYALERRGQQALDQMPAGLDALNRMEIPLLPFAPNGVQNLKLVFDPPNADGKIRNTAAPVQYGSIHLREMVDKIQRSGHGLIMTMGKGGVGKTTIAVALAIDLADRGFRVHLSTTDPASHIIETLGGEVPGFRVSRIDPRIETNKYVAEVLAQAAPHLDDHGKALLEEDLRSPCTEEIAVFRAFANIVAEGEKEFVVLDTAPTGHTLLLLDAAEAYHREVLRTLSGVPDPVKKLLPLLRDSEFTHIFLVTLPEATPVHEAARLQDDLLRAGITPHAWVVNQSFSASDCRDPILAERGASEQPYIKEVHDLHPRQISILPWVAAEPSGPKSLRKLMRVG